MAGLDMEMAGVDYDAAAGEYAAHRRIHPGVYRELRVRGRIGPGSTVLEVGCGTGNYITALSRDEMGRTACRAWGLDPSAGMLARARTRPEPVTWLQGRAEAPPFAPGSFDLVFAVDVIHHVADRSTFYRQAVRVLRPGGRLCTVTDSAEIIRRREILSGYFPDTIQVELARYPRLAEILAWMAAAGLVDAEVVTVEQPYELAGAGPYRDRAYSSLHLISDGAWQAGLARLEQALARGPVEGVSRYACVWGRKPAPRQSGARKREPGI
ncbi:MAG: methyltransferase domain-containing protein [Anaerolineae bacterium]